jgi:glycopeptide antibiotics resistance protein
VARNRLLYCGLTLAVILIGLASRRFPMILPAEAGKYPGDILWTMMVFFGLAVIWPKLGVMRLTAAALAISYAVEFSQLYQAPWINVVRAHPLGHLVLGSTFNSPDLAAYTLGALLAMLLELAIRRFAA